MGKKDVRDLLLAVIVAFIQVMGSRGANSHQPDAVHLDAFGYFLLVAGPAAIVFRRRYPVPVLLFVVAVTATYAIRGYGIGPIFIALVVAFLTTATKGSRWPYALIPAGYLVFVWPLPQLLGNPAPGGWEAGGIAAWLAILVGLAEGIRQRRTIVETRRQRAEEAERTEAEEQRRRESDERLAIARELHDVLAHSLSLINVQSSVALELLEQKPEQAATALAAIKAASRDALGEVHSLLTSIRSGTDSAPTAPTPSIADLDAVVERARAAGIDVATTVEGRTRKLPSVVDVAAARIIQESLTNVARHGSEPRARVALHYKPGALRITVDNDGAPAVPAATPSGGNGIPGMIERARALGGTVSAGPRHGGGFRVEALLPVEEEK